MSEVAEPADIADPAENLPKYCDHFKHLLVEELALEPDYRQLHYGKCAVSGRLCTEPDLFKLENVRLNHLPEEYILPGGTLSVLLLNCNYTTINAEGLANGNHCIVRGEVVLCNVRTPGSELLTARGVHEQLLRFADDDQAREQYLKTLHETHKPAIKVWFSNRIDEADLLAERKLEIRMLCQ